MEAYTGFAEVYDKFMNNVPYDQWEETLVELLREDGIEDGLILELGCGTGIMTERLADRGYDMIGIDLSEDMLMEAMEKRYDSGNNILYLNQDMREFELYGTVAAVYCICDSLNYLVEDGDLKTVFRLVNNYLDPRGLFLFDFNTTNEYRNPLRKAPIVETQDDATLIWENSFDEETKRNEHHVMFFLPVEDVEEEDEEILYTKVEEIHVQRAYELPEVLAALEEAGMEFVAAYDAATRGEVTAETCRVLCVAREKRMEGKQYVEVE